MSTVKEQKKEKTIPRSESQMISIEDIHVSRTRREIVPAKVAELAESILQVGLLNPITITRQFQLVAGAHRLEAYKQLGLSEIACTFLECDALHIELAEIDENLIRNDLDAISIGELAIRRDEIFEKLGLRANQSNKGKTTGEIISPVKTTSSIAKEIGMPNDFAVAAQQAAIVARFRFSRHRSMDS